MNSFKWVQSNKMQMEDKIVVLAKTYGFARQYLNREIPATHENREKKPKKDWIRGEMVDLPCEDPESSPLWADDRILNTQATSRLHKYIYIS
jgi:hypothetical protein